jgi:transcription initiation factor TFIID subunit 6
VVPNLKEYESLIKEDLQSNSVKRAEVEKVISAILNVLGSLVEETPPMMNGHSEEAAEEMRSKLVDKIGEVIGNKIADAGHLPLAKAILE